MQKNRNVDDRVVADFGEEWALYERANVSPAEHQRLFDIYFSEFPFAGLPPAAEGFDLGCGSGRWAEKMAARVGRIHCIDPAERALSVARRRLREHKNARFHLGDLEAAALPDGSQDFGYAIGVLHHMPDTARGLSDCVAKLKVGAPFLIYLYYRLENRPGWFVFMWRITDVVRRGVSRLPFPVKRSITDVITALVYWPFARLATVAERAGLTVTNMPLSAYRHAPFKTMRNDALDRFGTRLEQRFSRDEIHDMMRTAGLEDIRFREDEPFWIAVGIRGEPADPSAS